MSDLTVKQFQDSLHKLPLSMQAPLHTALSQIAVDVEGKAKDNVHPGSSPYFKPPWATGNMEGSINGRVVGTGKNQKAVVGASAEYSERIHDGDSKMQGRPFIFDAIVSENKNTISTLDEHLGAWIRGMKG